MKLLEHDDYARYSNDIIVMRIGPSDQMLNALLTNATLALQLSTREGFEVKVSEALYHGKPIIAAKAGGIPLQVQHGKNGYLVEPGDTRAVAGYLYKLWMDRDLLTKMSMYSKTSVSDEIGTVGNALCWMYLVATLSQGVAKDASASARGLAQVIDANRGDGVSTETGSTKEEDTGKSQVGHIFCPKGRWINDLAREQAGEPYTEGETRLPRGVFVEGKRRVQGKKGEKVGGDGEYADFEARVKGQGDGEERSGRGDGAVAIENSEEGEEDGEEKKSKEEN